MNLFKVYVLPLRCYIAPYYTKYVHEKIVKSGTRQVMRINHRASLAKNNLRKIAIIFLPISLNMCFGCSKEPSHRDGSFEYPQHMFWLRNKKNNFQLRTLIWSPEYLSLNFQSGSKLFYTWWSR